MTLNLLQKWELYYQEEILKDIENAGIEITLENIPLIIQGTSFKNRSKKYPDKCPYYQIGKSCHPEIKDLNCFLCACPNYNSEILEGECKIQGPKGKWFYHPSLPKGKIWDCSNCHINHSPKEVENYLREKLRKN